MLKAVRIAGGVALILLISVLVTPAMAHSAADWYDVVGSGSQGQRFPWNQASDTTYKFDSDSTWPTGWKNAVRAADGHWNDALGRTLFDDLPNDAAFPTTDCNAQAFGEEFIRHKPASGSSLAINITCYNPTDDVYGRWWITIDTTPTWLTGTGDAPAGQMHLRGIMTQEFRHATGFGSGCNNTCAGHFSESDNAACPSNQAIRATMCENWGVSPNATEQYRMTTLEADDTHTFLQVY
jgi:hypothetical protein